MSSNSRSKPASPSAVLASVLWNGWTAADCALRSIQARLFLFISPATRLARSPVGRSVGAKLMTLIDSDKSPGRELGDGDPWLLPALTGVETDLMVFVGKVPREPSGKDRVEMSIEDTAVVGLDWADTATCREPPSADAFRRGGRGGRLTSLSSLVLPASASRTIVKTPSLYSHGALFSLAVISFQLARMHAAPLSRAFRFVSGGFLASMKCAGLFCSIIVVPFLSQLSVKLGLSVSWGVHVSACFVVSEV